MRSDVTRARGEPGAPRRLSNDSGAITIVSLVKYAVVAALLIAVAHDGITMIALNVKVRDLASQAAQLGHDAIIARKPVSVATTQIEDFAKAQGLRIAANGVVVKPTGEVVVTVSRAADTYLVGRIPPLARYTTMTATATANNSTL